MASTTYNPFPLLGTQLSAGLDSIVAALGATPKESDLVDAIYAYVQPIYYPGTPSTQVEMEIKSVAYYIINAYIDRSLFKDMYSPEQYRCIGFMLGRTTTTQTPVDALSSWIDSIEQIIPELDLALDEQTPLQLAIEIGSSIVTYWETKVATPGSWSTFFDPTAANNNANIPHWTAAAMEGALVGANASPKGLITPTTDIVSVNMISSLIGGLAIGAGKVIFKWVPNIQPSQLAGGYSSSVGLGGGDTLMGNNDRCIVNNCGTATCANDQCTPNK